MTKKNLFIEKIFLQSANEEYAQAILRLFVLIPFFFLFLVNLFFLIMTHCLQLVNEKLQEQLKIQKNQEMILLQQSRNAAMGEMISNIAHQWRQPLNALGLLLQNIENMYEMDMLDDVYIKKSINKGTNLTQTIDDFRDFFKPNKEKKIFDISSVTKDTLSIVEATFKHNEIKVILELAKSSEFYGYLNEFSQAILNILTNAKDALVEKKYLMQKFG